MLPPFDPTQRIPFRDVYTASKPPNIRAMMAITDDQARAQAAHDLAVSGAIIDLPIMVWGWTPYDTMYQRLIDGLDWVPNAIQPSIGYSVGQGDNPPYVPYDASKPPANSIKASINPADYPAFDPPAPPAPPAEHHMVGIFNGWVYVAGPDAMKDGIPQVANGQTVTQDGVNYTAVVPPKGPFGYVVWFLKS